MTYLDLSQLPSTFYRVAAKLLVRDDQDRILMVRNPKGVWEIPGGGWEHNETLEQCLDRELQEELGVGLNSVGSFCGTYTSASHHGYLIFRLIYEGTISSNNFVLGDGMTEARYMTQQEFLDAELGIDSILKTQIDQIWPTA